MSSERTDPATNNPSSNLNPAPRCDAHRLAGAGARSTLAFGLLLTLTLLPFSLRSAHAQSEIVLYNFTGGSDGGTPESRLVFDQAGNLYGTTTYGGSGDGTVFELSPNGSGEWNETVLHAFSYDTDGGAPDSYLIFDAAGNLYGTSHEGGPSFGGVVFELSSVGSSWEETVLYAFTNGADGAYPINGVIMDRSGNLYGTTSQSLDNTGGAVVFELSPSNGGWTEQSIYSLGIGPSFAGLTIDSVGDIYGATFLAAFELSPNGSGGWTPSTVYNFPGFQKDGTYPEAAPVFDQAGNLYGTTFYGGAKDNGTVYQLHRGKWAWKEKSLHSFGSGIDGMRPDASVVFDAAGNIYGTTITGGKYGYGTVFELVLSLNGSCYKEKILWNFNSTDGASPTGSLILDSAGNLYGTTSYGGSSGNGVVFEVTP